MEQDNGRTTPANFVENLSVVAAQGGQNNVSEYQPRLTIDAL